MLSLYNGPIRNKYLMVSSGNDLCITLLGSPIDVLPFWHFLITSQKQRILYGNYVFVQSGQNEQTL